LLFFLLFFGSSSPLETFCYFPGLLKRQSVDRSLRNQNAQNNDDGTDDLNTLNDEGRTALMISVDLGNEQDVKTLVENGADIAVQSPCKEYEGQNVLHVLVRKSVEDSNNVSRYLSMYQIIDKHRESSESLMSAIKQEGSCTFKPRFSNEKMAAVEYASAVGAIDMLKCMLQLLSTDTINADYMVKSLHAAANYGQPKAIRVIVDVMLTADEFSRHLSDKRKFSLDFGYGFKPEWTALHTAVYRGHTQCIKQLHGLDARTTDQRQYRPIHLAAESKTRNVMDVFLKTFSHQNDAELNAVTKFGLTPLMMSALIGNVEGVKQLVEYGADVEKTVHGRDNSVGEQNDQNVLHIIVRRSVEDSDNVSKYIEMYNIITRSYIENKQIQNLNRKLLQTRGKCQFSGRFENQLMTVLQYAAAIGAVDMLETMIDSLLEDNKSENCDAVLKYLIPGENASSQTKQESENDVRDTSCLELISRYCSLSQMAQMERIQPITRFVSRYANRRMVIFCIILAIHVTHMAFLTRIATADGNEVNSTATRSSGESISRRNLIDFHVLFIIWPTILSVFEVLSFIKAVYKLPSWRRQHINLLPERSQYSIIYLDVIDHMAVVAFCVLMWTWYCAGQPPSDGGVFDPRRKTGLTAALLVTGWLQTLAYIRWPQKLHTFVAILKLIFIKDVIYILCIYAFILVGFAASIYVFLLTSVNQDMTLYDCVYHVYTTMLGDGKLFDEVVSASNSHMVRGVFAVYLCLSIVVLLNMLIAMMNNRYSNVLEIRRSLWYIETVNSIAWVNDFLFCNCFKRLFNYLSANIAKPVKHERAEIDIKGLYSRIDVLEANVEDIRSKLDEILK
jgi:ankyrin repeat protein